MSRPQKVHPPIKGNFNNILAAVAMGIGKGKAAAHSLEVRKEGPPKSPPKKV
jgi:hypothetical protein